MTQTRSFARALESLEKAQATLDKEGTKLLKDAAEQAFAANPGLDALRWMQFTPYFNDGDVCEFGLMNMQAKVFGESDPYCEDGFIDVYHIGPLSEDPGGIFFSVLREMPLDFLKRRFGDHARITITKDGGVAVDEYEHD